MKRICYPIIFFFVVAFFVASKTGIYAQQAIDFSFERTGPNHSVLALPMWHPVITELQQLDTLPAGMVLGFQGDTLETGDLVGVFFTDNKGNYKCAGSLTWKANDFNMLPVWGQYPTGTDNGMEMGEKMTWLAQKKDNTIYEIESSYQRPLMSIYIKDGASAVLGMELTASENLKPLNPFKK
jgi:hypothetical protein